MKKIILAKNHQWLKKYLAIANQLGESTYGLVAGQTYKLEEGLYGTVVYDIFGNYVTEASKNAFDGYKEIIETEISKQPKTLQERIVEYCNTHKETIYETVMDDTECSVEREVLDPEEFLKWLAEQTE